MAKIDLAQIWDNLNALRCKQQFVNEADMIMNDQLFGKILLQDLTQALKYYLNSPVFF